MTATRLGLLGLTALVLSSGAMALGAVVAHAAGAPAWVGRLCGLAIGFTLSTLALRRGYDRGLGAATLGGAVPAIASLPWSAC